MALKLIYYGQNDSVNATPDCTLVGDPGTDQPVLTASGYLGGTIMAIGNLGILVARGTNASGNEAATSPVIVPCDTDNGSSASGNVPFAVLLNGSGEFSGAIGPSGSKKAPVVRAMWQGNLTSESYDANIVFGGSHAVTIGSYLYCGGSSKGGVGMWTTYSNSTTKIGICTHVPTTTEPWLGVASLL